MEINFELTQVSENTVMVSHEAARSNAGALILKDFIVAIDCTMWPYTAQLFRKILEEKYQLPVKYLCLTHSHGDHVMGLKSFKDTTIFGCEKLQESIPHRIQTQWTPDQMAEMKTNRPEIADWVDEVEFLIPPLLFHDRMEIINQHQKIEFQYSGGHTDDSVWAYYPDEKVLFSGDLIFSNWFPYAGDETCDPEQWMKILRIWLEMPINKVVPGHGPVMGLEIVEKTLQCFKQLKQNTLDVLTQNGNADNITIPDLFEITDDSRWVVKKTLDHWYQFYLGI